MCKRDNEIQENFELQTPRIEELNPFLVEALGNPHDEVHGHSLLIMRIFDTRGQKAFDKSIKHTITPKKKIAAIKVEDKSEDRD